MAETVAEPPAADDYLPLNRRRPQAGRMIAPQPELEPDMTSRPHNVLRYALIADALASGATGLLMAVGAGPLSGLLSLPEPLLRWAGIVLLPFAILVALAARPAEPSRSATLAIIFVNALWVLDSFALLATGWVAPNGLGVAFVAVQALAVGALAAAQAAGMGRSGQSVAASA